MPLLPPLTRVQAVEAMEQPQPPAAMAACLADLARLNLLLGVRRLVLRLLEPFLAPGTTTLTLADVATGGADLPRAFVAWGRARGVTVRVLALDRHPVVAALAQDATASVPAIAVVVGDARALPLPDGAVDVAICTSTLHHFAPDEAVTVLRELDRVGRRGFIVTDLVRAWGAYAGARVLAATVQRSPITRADGPLSVRRAYTVPEVEALCARAGLREVTLRRHPLFRLSLVCRRPDPDGRHPQPGRVRAATPREPLPLHRR